MNTHLCSGRIYRQVKHDWFNEIPGCSVWNKMIEGAELRKTAGSCYVLKVPVIHGLSLPDFVINR